MRLPLLARGFLPRELPPPFSSDTLGIAYGAIATPGIMATTMPRRTTAVVHNLPRVGLMRRPLAIPDPVRYLLLVDSLLAGSADLSRLFTLSDLSITRPRRDHTGQRSHTFKVAFADQGARRARVRAGARYILQADINKFYGSIYTHAIPWAFHTKLYAKSHRGPGLVGNAIDECVRNGQDGQTMGVPIGPDTSFLIAEALLGSFDSTVIARMEYRPGLRMMDEYEFAFDTYSQAEEGIATLQDELGKFELSLNPRKTVIRECPLPINAGWVTDLQAIPLPNSGPVARKLLLSFVDRAFDLAHQRRGDPILQWAVSRLMSLSLNRSQWDLVQQLIFQAAAAEPGALPRCLRLLLSAALGGHSIDNSGLGRTLGVAASNAVRRGHGSEAAWAVWGHILFNLPIDASLSAVLGNSPDDVVALVSLDARARGLMPAGTTFPLWEASVNGRGLVDGHWLLTYEATIKGWIAGHVPNPVAGNPAFADMAARGVTFYRSEIQSLLLWRTRTVRPTG